MVVEERLTSTLCNCTTSPLKNSALLFLRYIVSGYLSFFQYYICTNKPEDGKLVALPKLDHTGAEFVIFLTTISHKYAFQEIHKYATEILEHTASSNSVLMQSCSSATLSLMVDVAVQCGIPHLLSSVVDK